ncbi:MAG TPA: hypothetical protein PKD54_06425, partial [Pirellulaceae bacterium]|nr:hypothetical protein [Pirellulaceae bacterium]
LGPLRDDQQNWVEEKLFWEPNGGCAIFNGPARELSVMYTDSGVEQAEVTLNFRGVRMVRDKEP